MTLHAREWKERYSRAPVRMNKPKACPLRGTEPRGPLKGCEETCKVFEACVELNRQEKAQEERMERDLERLKKLEVDIVES